MYSISVAVETSPFLDTNCHPQSVSSRQLVVKLFQYTVDGHEVSGSMLLWLLVEATLDAVEYLMLQCDAYRWDSASDLVFDST